MTKLIVVRGDNALRRAAQSKFLDFIYATTDEEEQNALKDLMALDNRLSYRGALRLVEEEFTADGIHCGACIK